MTGTSILNVLLGAALVAIGVLAAALADRIRGLRISREVAPRERAIRMQSIPVTAIPVVESTESMELPPPAAPVKMPRAPRAESKGRDGADDVIAALVAAGYKKPAAAEATWSCTAAERTTVESWAAAALRRCARGGMS